MNRNEYIESILKHLKKNGDLVRSKTLEYALKNIVKDIYYADKYGKRKDKKMNFEAMTKSILTAGYPKLTAKDIHYTDIETSTSDRFDYLGEYMARNGLQTTLMAMLEKHPHLLFKNDELGEIEAVWATVRHPDTVGEPVFDLDMEIIEIWRKE